MNRTYLVGRSPEADLRIASKHDSVSKLHMEITVLGGNRVCIIDRRSANGLSVRTGNGWKPVKGAEEVNMDAEVRLGEYNTTVRDLLALGDSPPTTGGRGRDVDGDGVTGRRVEPEPIRNYEDQTQRSRRRE
jgi:predicted component of type VI protein secretion system